MIRSSSLKAYGCGFPHETLRDKAMAVIYSQRDYGVTNYDLCKMLRKQPNSISPRLGELEEMGLVKRLRDTRLNPNTKRHQNIYVDIRYVNDRPTEEPLGQRSKKIEEMLSFITGKIDRKGSIFISYGDEIHKEILEVLK